MITIETAIKRESYELITKIKEKRDILLKKSNRESQFIALKISLHLGAPIIFSPTIYFT